MSWSKGKVWHYLAGGGVGMAFWRTRRPGWVAVGSVAFIAGITVWLLLDKKSGVDTAVILTLTATLAGLAVAAAGLVPRRPLTCEVRELADRVALERGRARRQALGMSGDARPADVGFRSPSRQDEPELVRWRSDGGRERGTLSDVAGFYQSLDRGRLVVLGEPGSGKTVLATQLVLDLIEELPDGDLRPARRPPVPVWLSLTSLDLGDPESLAEAAADELAARLDRWIVEQLTAVYQVRARVAGEVLAGHWIVPVLDGLDEMDPAAAGQGAPPRPRAAAVVRALNDGTGRRPVVLVCRRAEYRQLARSPGPAGDEPVLLDASQIVLQPLERDVICAHLADRFPGSGPDRMAARWEPVRAALEAAAASAQAAGSVLEVLSSPWRLFLAVMAYHEDGTDPSQMLRHRGTAATSELLEQLIPAATALTPAPAGVRYPPDEVRDWLAVLAGHLHDTSEDPALRWSPTDLRLERLWPIAGAATVQWITRIAAPVIVAAVFAVPGLIWVHSTRRWFPDTGQAWLGLSLVLFAVILSPSLTVIKNFRIDRLDLASLRFSAGRRRLAGDLAANLAVGLAGGLAIGLAHALAIGLAIWVAFGLVAGLAGGLTFGLGGSFALASRPTSVMRQNAAYILAVGLAIGLSVGLAVGLALGLAVGLMFTLTFALAAGLAFGLAYGLVIWLRYLIGSRLARRKGLLPPRVGRFLDWAYRANLLRMSGTAAQFRHRELQDWLLSTRLESSEPPAQAETGTQGTRLFPRQNAAGIGPPTTI